jgi:hypothetical protein
MTDRKICCLYVKNRYTLRRIAALAKSNHHAISRILKRHGIKVTVEGRKRPPFTAEHRKKISQANLGRKSWSKGLKLSEAYCRINMKARLRTALNDGDAQPRRRVPQRCHQQVRCQLAQALGLGSFREQILTMRISYTAIEQIRIKCRASDEAVARQRLLNEGFQEVEGLRSGKTIVLLGEKTVRTRSEYRSDPKP